MQRENMDRVERGLRAAIFFFALVGRLFKFQRPRLQDINEKSRSTRCRSRIFVTMQLASAG
jgi:hypothetical protein